MRKYLKILCAVLALLMLTGLCACAEENENTNPNKPVIKDPPETIYGSWYALPDVSETPIEVAKDGTCVVLGKSWTWKTKSVEDDKVVLTVGEGEEAFELTFTRLTTNIPILAGKSFGWSVKQSQLWSYMLEWENAETAETFTLTLFDLTQADCGIQLEEGKMIVTVPAGQYAGYTLEVTTEQCIVKNAQGESTTYIPMVP